MNRKEPNESMTRTGDRVGCPAKPDIGRSSFDGASVIEEVEELLAPVLSVGAREVGEAYARLHGRPRPGAAEAYPRAAAAAWKRGWEIQLSDAGGGVVTAYVRPLKAVPDRARRLPIWNVILVLATLITTVWAGAMHRGVDLLADPDRWPVGVPYALTLLAILSVHELGHYIMARRHRIPVSLPFFIPAPFFLGTLGAFIRMETSARTRNAYFDVAVAGPLAGLVVSVLAIAAGTALSVEGVGPGMDPDSSLLFYGLYRLAGGPAARSLVALGPVDFAGWIGLVVTALNLLPVGQLDGGHMAYALFGPRRARTLGTVVIGALVAAGLFYSPHWLVWAAIVWAVAGVGHPPARDEVQRLSPGRRALAWSTLAILLTIVLPVPR